MDCLFCKISAGEIPSQKIYENESVLGFLDIQPVAPGHTVVVPKAHAENILDLRDDMIAPLFLGVREVTRALKKTLNPDGFTIGINHGEAGGQAVDHLHIHVIPRFKGDGGGSLHTVVHNAPKEPLEQTATRIQEVM